ncbi:cytochrome P450 [Pisolithus tinctorius]|nr:cytochrome P450 [Pisolithus tinctorius]
MNVELWTTASCTTILAVAVFICLFEGRRRSQELLRDVPMPGGASLLWGHERMVSQMSVGEAYAQWMDQLHSQTIKIRGALFKPDIVRIFQISTAATHIMQRHVYDYPHSDVVRPRIARLLGKSLGWVELADNLEMHLLEHGGSTVVSIVDWVNQATLEAIGRLGFGHDFGGGRNGDAQKILGVWRTMAAMGVSRVGPMAVMMLRRFPIFNSLPLKALRVQGDVRKTIHEGVARELLRRNANTDLRIRGNDLLARLTGSIGTDELWIIMFMIRNDGTVPRVRNMGTRSSTPHVQTRLREEAMAYHGSPSYDDLQTQLPYLDAVTREVLRLHPALPYMERIRRRKINHFPSQLSIRLCSVWGDGKKFRPDRWMGDLPPKDLCSTGWSRMLTFSDGPRICIGYKFAILQFKVILLTLVRRFEFKDTGCKACGSRSRRVGPRLPVHVSLC